MSSLLYQSVVVFAIVTGAGVFLGYRLGVLSAKKRLNDENEDSDTTAPDAAAFDRLERRLDAMVDLCRRAVEGSGEVAAATLDELRRLFPSGTASAHGSGESFAAASASAMTDASLHRQLETILAENERLVHALRDKEETFLRLEEQLHHRLREADEALSEEHRLAETLERRLHDLENKVDPDLVGPDDLGMIRGVGASSKKILEQLGIHSFKDLAVISAADLEKLKAKVPFPDRIAREDWIGQAIEKHFRKYSEKLTNPRAAHGRRKAA